MEETGESSSQPVFYGPPRPPEMLERMRLEAIRAEEEQIVLRENAMIAAGQYCKCEWSEFGDVLPPDSDSDEDEPCPFHPWNQRVPGQAPQPQWPSHHHHPHDHHHHEMRDEHEEGDGDDGDDDDDGHGDGHGGDDSDDDGSEYRIQYRPGYGHRRWHGIVVPQMLPPSSVPEPRPEAQVPGETQEPSHGAGPTQSEEQVGQGGGGGEWWEYDYSGDDDDDDGDDDDDEDDEDDEDHDPNAPRPYWRNMSPSALGAGGFNDGLTHQQLIGILHSQNLAEVFNFIDSSDESSNERPRSQLVLSRVRTDARMPEPKPTAEGIALQGSGSFGANETSPRSNKHMMTRLLDREHAFGSLAERAQNSGLLVQDMIPQQRADTILHYDEPVYSGQFSADGNFYYSVCQDFKVRMYDTSNPHDWKHYKTVTCPWGSWTITDASLSPDNRWLVYGSHSNLVSITPTDPLDTGDPYTLDLEGGLEGDDLELARRMSFSVFSVRFSGDGRELVAGTRQNTIVVYDIEQRAVVLSIMGHENDVNAVCFANKEQPHLIFSGSDDGVLKFWDRRSLKDKREAGAFLGHKGGLTYIDSKEDGRYVLSNGKDQTVKLWDIRKAYSSEQFHGEDMARFTRYAEYDYRYMNAMDVEFKPHPKDNSVVTFWGHKVQRTLIRCHFAPPNSANSRYVYAGSADGRVHIWNIDSTVAKVIDVGEATKYSRQKDRNRRYYTLDSDPDLWETCVRDVSWHPNESLLAASAWNSYNMSRGTTSVHSFCGPQENEDDIPTARSYNAVVERQEGLYDKEYV